MTFTATGASSTLTFTHTGGAGDIALDNVHIIDDTAGNLLDGGVGVDTLVGGGGATRSSAARGRTC